MLARIDRYLEEHPVAYRNALYSQALAMGGMFLLPQFAVQYSKRGSPTVPPISGGGGGNPADVPGRRVQLEALRQIEMPVPVSLPEPGPRKVPIWDEAVRSPAPLFSTGHPSTMDEVVDFRDSQKKILLELGGSPLDKHSANFWNNYARAHGLRGQYDTFRHYVAANYSPPDPYLVGIETNPGPRGRRRNNKNKNNQNKNKNPPAVIRRGPTSRPVSVYQAPNSTFVDMGTPFHRFLGGGKNGKTLIIQGRQMVGQAVVQAVSTAPAQERCFVGRDSSIYYYSTLRPPSNVVGSPLNSISLPFAKFRYLGAKVTYCPAISTAVTGQLAMSFIDDPTMQNLNFLSLVGTDGSCSTPLWKPCAVAFNRKSDDWYYTAVPGGPTTTDIRMCAQFAFAAMFAGNYAASLTAGTVTGTFWLDYVLELDDMTAAQATQPTLSFVRSIDGVVDSSDSKEEDARPLNPSDSSQVSLGRTQRRDSDASQHSFLNVASQRETLERELRALQSHSRTS